MENYEQKYKEALENFKKIKSANSDNKELVNFIEYEYPELKESEDERIRKELIERFNWELKGAEEQDAAGCSRQKDIAMFKRGIAWLEKQGEQKPSWSEEDEKCFIELDTIIYQNSSLEDYNRLYNWLKSLKERVQPQSMQDWSEEDESNLNGILDCYKSMDIKWRNWLKSIKPNHWKPSDTQMSMLLAVLNDSNNISSESVQIALKSLYNDLKKL